MEIYYLYDVMFSTRKDSRFLTAIQVGAVSLEVSYNVARAAVLLLCSSLLDDPDEK